MLIERCALLLLLLQLLLLLMSGDSLDGQSPASVITKAGIDPFLWLLPARDVPHCTTRYEMAWGGRKKNCKKTKKTKTWMIHCCQAIFALVFRVGLCTYSLENFQHCSRSLESFKMFVRNGKCVMGEKQTQQIPHLFGWNQTSARLWLCRLFACTLDNNAAVF